MSIYGGRNWADDLRRRQADLAAEAQRNKEWAYQSQRNAFRQAQWNAEFDRAEKQTDALVTESDIAKEAREGTVIDGVVVRKPQPRLT